MPLRECAAPGGLQVVYENGQLLIAWQADTIPPGYFVSVQITDGQDNSLSPAPEIEIFEAYAIAVGESIRPGMTLMVRVQALSPKAGPETVQLISLMAPGEVQLLFNSNGLNILWERVDGATGYDLEVADENGHPFLPQPPATLFIDEQPVRALLNIDDLLDRTVYRLRVRAIACGSRSTWSSAADIFVDKTRPISTLLCELLERLKNAGSAFDLGPDMIRSENITLQFASLLRATGGKLSVRDAAVSSSLDSVTLQAKVDLFHVADKFGIFVFTEHRGSLELDMSYPLGTCTISQLKESDLLPGDSFSESNWAVHLAALNGLILKLSTARRRVTVISEEVGPTWSVLGIPGVSLLPVKPELQILAPLPNLEKEFIPRVLTEIDLGSSRNLSIFLQFPAGSNPWKAGLLAPIYIGSLTEIYKLFGGQGPGLPDGLANLGQVTLDALTVAHPPGGDAWLWDLAVTLGSVPGDDRSEAPRWSIISDVLALDRLGFALKLNVVSAADGFIISASGVVWGRFILAGLDPLNVMLSVPGTDGVWTLFATTSQSFDLSQAAQLLNGSRTALGDSLAKVGNASSFILDGLEIGFKPQVPELTRLALAVSINSFSVPSLPWFTVETVRGVLVVQNPMNDQTRAIRGELKSLMTLGSVKVGVVTSFDENSVWTLQIAAAEDRLNNLEDLSSLIPSNTVRNHLPANLPTNGGFKIGALGFSYHGQEHYFPAVYFTLKSEINWEIVPDIFTINSVNIAIDRTQENAAAEPAMTGHVSGILTILGARFQLEASKPQAGENWTLSGWLDSELTIDFNKILHELISPDWSIPSGFGFPTALTIRAARASLVPATGAFDFAGDALLDWSFAFGQTSFAIKSLGALIHKKGTGDSVPSSALIYGTFAIGQDISGDASIQLGSGKIDTIIEIDVGTGTSLSPSSVLADITGLSDPMAAVAKPDDFSIPIRFNASILANLSKQSFLAWGEISSGGEESLYGMVALLVQKQLAAENANIASGADPAWGFIISAALKNWSFSAISSSLSLVDQVLSVDVASLAVANFDSAQQTSPFDKLQLMQLGESRPVKSGLSFYGHLTFHKPLLRNVGRLLQNIDQSTIEIYGHIGKNLQDTIFCASLGEFTVLQAVHFASLRLEYQPGIDVVAVQPDLGAQTTPVLRILGKGDLNIPFMGEAGQQDKKIEFDGKFTITNRAADFALLLEQRTDQDINQPFRMKGIHLQRLGLQMHVPFGDDAGDASIIRVYGDAMVGSYTVEGSILFKNSMPWVCSVEFSETLAAGDLFNQSIGTTNYQPGSSLPIIAFESGKLYYAREEWRVSDSLTYRAGFNLETKLLIFTWPFEIMVAIAPNDGITAVGLCRRKISLGFFQITGPDPVQERGPDIIIKANNESKSVELNFGITLFGIAFRDGKLSYSNGVYAGSISYSGNILGINNPTISAQWSERDGFKVTQWPILPQILPGDINYAHLFKSICSGDACGVLGDLGLDNGLFDTTFSGHVQLISSPQTNEKSTASSLPIQLTVEAKLILNALGLKKTLDTVILDLPMVIEAPESLDISGFFNFITNNLIKNIDQLIRKVINNPAALAEIASIMAFSAATDKALSYFICKNVKTDPVKNATTSRVSQSATEGEGSLAETEGFSGVAASAETATGAAGAAAAAEASGDVAIGLFAGAIAFISTTLLFGWFASEEQREMERKKKAAEEAKKRAIEAVVAKLQISGTVAITYRGENDVQFAWQKPLGGEENVSYKLEVTVGTKTISVDSSCRDKTIRDDSFLPGALIRAKVNAVISAVYEGKTYNYSGNKTAESSYRIPAAEPRNVQIEQNADGFFLWWSAGETSAASYEIQLQPGGLIYQTAESSFAIGTSSLQPNSDYFVSVRAKTEFFSSGWVNATPSPIRYMALEPATDITCNYHTGEHQIDLKWRAPPGLTFDIRLRTPDGTPVIPESSAAPKSLPEETYGINLTSSQFLDNFRLKAEIGSKLRNLQGVVWSRPLIVTLTALSAPEIESFSFLYSDPEFGGLPTFKATWLKGIGTTGAIARLSDEQGIALKDIGEPIINRKDRDETIFEMAVFTDFRVKSGQVVAVQVQVNNEASISPWSAIAVNSKARVPSVEPRSVIVEQVDKNILLQWLPGESRAISYAVCVKSVPSASGEPIDITDRLNIEINKDNSAIISDKNGSNVLIPGSEYQVTIQAMAEKIVSDPISAEPSPIRYQGLRAPIDLKTVITPETHTLHLSWQSSPDTGNRFKVEVKSDGNTLMDEMVTRPGEETLWQCDLPFQEITEDRVLKIRVASVAVDGGLVWSELIVTTKLSMPDLLPLRFSDDVLTVSMTIPVAGAQTYTVQLIRDGNPGEIVTVSSSEIRNATVALEAKFPLNPNEDAASYQARTRALAENRLPSAWVLSNDSVVRLLPPPAPSIILSEDVITASFRANVSDADGYHARLIVNGQPRGKILEMNRAPGDLDPSKAPEEFNEFQAKFPVAGDAAGTVYRAQVRIWGRVQPSSKWMTSENSLVMIVAPSIVSVSLNEGQGKLTVGFEAVNGAAGYNLRLTDKDGKPLENQPAFGQMVQAGSSIGWTFDLPSGLLKDGIRAQVQAKGTSAELSAWSILSNIAVSSQKNVPTNLVLSYNSDIMSITWQDSIDDVDHYEVQVLAGEGRVPVDPQANAAFSGKTATINAKELGGGQTYRVRIRAVKAEYRNVLKNGDASHGFDSWNILKNDGDRWKVEDGPAASCPCKPVRYNFVTSYGWDAKAQTIDLLAEGLKRDFLDLIPKIEVSEWICSRTDCLGRYRLLVELRDEKQKSIDRFDTGVIDAPIAANWVYPWTRVAHTFNSYPKGLRFIYFEHSGIDTKFWAGHYGSKMTCAEVRIRNAIGDTKTAGEWSAESNPITTRAAGAPAQIIVIAGNDQIVARTDPTGYPGGTAQFGPILAKVMDSSGIPISSVPVTFVSSRPRSMAVLIGAGGYYLDRPQVVNSNIKGVSEIDGVKCIFDQGPFVIVASTDNGIKQNINLTVAPTPLRIAPPGVILEIVSGNNQSVPLGNIPNMKGAWFKPLQVRLTDPLKRPMPNELVDFRSGSRPSSKMHVQVHFSGGEPATVLTDKDGIATLEGLYTGYSVFAENDVGQFTIVASVEEGGPKVFFQLTVK